MGGYHGRYLRIDLNRSTANYVALSESVLRRFLGGVGLGTWLLHHESPPGVDPLTAEGALVFCFSPLVGTPLTTSAKFAVVAKSPLTFRLNNALSSSHFALAGKRSGADALVIVGACAVPSVLVIEDGTIRIEPAGELWGLDSDETTKQLGERFGPEFHSAVIGPAGEKLVRYATISHANRHAGRGGLGAVMGSKRLKAILVAGTQRVPVADPTRVIAAARDLSQRSFGPATAKYRELGTVSNLLTFNRLHALPTRNFQQGQFEQAENLSGESLNAAESLANRVRPARSVASTSIPVPPATSAWNTKACSPSARCAASATATSSSEPHDYAIDSASTRSPSERPWPSRWSAQNGGCSLQTDSASATARRCSRCYRASHIAKIR